jgi:hypothetical protein
MDKGLSTRFSTEVSAAAQLRPPIRSRLLGRPNRGVSMERFAHYSASTRSQAFLLAESLNEDE